MKDRIVNNLGKKLLSQIVGSEQRIRSKHQLVKNIHSKLMTYEQFDLNDELVEKLINSEWFY